MRCIELCNAISAQDGWRAEFTYCGSTGEYVGRVYTHEDGIGWICDKIAVSANIHVVEDILVEALHSLLF